MPAITAILGISSAVWQSLPKKEQEHIKKLVKAGAIGLAVAVARKYARRKPKGKRKRGKRGRR